MWSARPLTAEKYASPCGNGEKSNKPVLEKDLLWQQLLKGSMHFARWPQNNRVHDICIAEQTPAPDSCFQLPGIPAAFRKSRTSLPQILIPSSQQAKTLAPSAWVVPNA